MVEGGEKGAVAMLDLVVEVFVFLKQHGYLIGIEIELKMRIVFENIYVAIKGCNREVNLKVEFFSTYSPHIVTISI